MAGVIGARDALTNVAHGDRAGLRQLATTTYSPRQVIDEPANGWGIASAQIGRVTMHIRLSGHTAALCRVRTLTLPDGRNALASASDDGTIRLWDPDTATPIGTPLTGHASTVEDICVLTMKSGRVLLASAGGDGTVRIWDPAAGRQVGEAMAGHIGAVWGVCTLPGWDANGRPDGRTLLATTGYDGTVRLWDPAIRQQVGTALTGHAGPVWGICTLEGRTNARTLLVTTGLDGTVRIWDPAAGRQVGEALTGHTGRVRGVCTLPGWDATSRADGRTLLATTGADATVQIWDPATGRAVGEPLSGLPNTVDVLTPPISFAPGCITVDNGGAVQVWNPVVASLAKLPSALYASTALTLAGSGHGFLFIGDTIGQVHITDAAGVQVLYPPTRIDHGAVLALCPLPGEPPQVAAAGRSGTITVLPITNGKTTRPVLQAHAGPVRSLCLIERRDDPPLLASAGNDGAIRIWDLDSWAPYGDPLTSHDGWIWSIAALPMGGETTSRVASAGADHTIRLWDPVACRQIGQPLLGHTDQVRAVSWARIVDGRTLLISGSHDGTVRLWHPHTGELLRIIPLGIPVHALLQQQSDPRSRERTDDGATITVGLRTGIVALDIHSSLFSHHRTT